MGEPTLYRVHLRNRHLPQHCSAAGCCDTIAANFCESEADNVKLVSWNVNGLRACIQKGWRDFFDAADADIFAIQETKLQEGITRFQKYL